MKTVVVQRAWSDDRATLGMLSILGEKHNPIFVLENPLRATTVDSRIPGGQYLCSPYSGTKYKDVYIVHDVPEREAILFHWGNYEADTEGCLLVGLSAGIMNGQIAVMESKPAFKVFSDLIGKEEFILVLKERYEG